ncbi:MAG: hypothetical protein QMC68_05295 [Bacteroidia bacterium]
MQSNIYLNIHHLPKKIILVLWVCTLSSFVLAQESKVSSFSFGASAATNGYGLHADLALQPKGTLLHGFQVSTQTILHPKETKVQNSQRTNSKPYVFGKINAGGTFRLSYTLGKELGTLNTNFSNLMVGISGGPSLGLLKPYLVGYQDPDNTGSKPDIIQQNETSIGNQDNIYGPASWTRGFKNLTVTPGFHLDFHLKIKWISPTNTQSWTTGVRLDYFSDQYQILYKSDKQAFTSIYTAYSLGRNKM